MEAITEMIEAFSELTVGELVGYIVLFLMGVATVVEKTSKTLKPLTKLARAIGRAINGEVLEKVNVLENKLKVMEETEEIRDVKAARTRVLRFGDELIHNVKHTKEHFDDVLRDITAYEKYCDEHPKFENDQMHITAEYIKSTYRKCLETHNFI